MTFQIASFPGRGGFNPYIDLFYDAMKEYGVELVAEIELRRQWFEDASEVVEGLHLHWPESLWREYQPVEPGRIRKSIRAHIPGAWRLYEHVDQVKRQPFIKRRLRLFRKLKGLLTFRKLIKNAGYRGIRVIWTFHNVESHEGMDWIDRWGYRFLAKRADLVIFHSEHARSEGSSRYQLLGNSVVMPIGNYEGVYPLARPRRLVLEELSLREDLPVVSCLGAMRDYKGLDLACEAVRLLNGEVQLLCAGAPHARFDVEALRKEVDSLPHAIMLPRFLSEQEFADYTSISSVILLPYRKITGSSALLSALTLSRGVVASDLAYFQEVLGGDSNAGRLVRPEDPVALAEGIREYLKVPARVREEAAARLSERYNWSEVVRPVVDVLQKWSSK